MTDTTEKSDLEKIVKGILKEISGIEAIYLFGSIAKGKENERSDYDIAVIVREYPEKDLDIIARKRYSLLGKIKRPLEILRIGMDDLEYSSPFLYEIYHASRLLYGTDILIRCEKVVKNIRPIIAEASGALHLHYICVHLRLSAVRFLGLKQSCKLHPFRPRRTDTNSR